MNIAKIKFNDIANGEGIRTSLFVSGCKHHCKNCFNKIAWDFNYGRKFDEYTQKQILDSVRPRWIQGITVLGGEPFEPENQKDLLNFLINFKHQYPNKTIWCYTGFIYEDIIGLNSSRAYTEYSKQLLKYIDILIDGPFIEEQKDFRLHFRGSNNQRIIDLRKTCEQNQMIEY